MTFRELDADDLDGWRTHPVTATLLREIRQRLDQRHAEMRAASVDAPIDRIRRLSGSVEEIEWIDALVRTKGVENT